MEEEAALAGASAEDGEAEFIRRLTEMELLDGECKRDNLSLKKKKKNRFYSYCCFPPQYPCYPTFSLMMHEFCNRKKRKL